MRSSDQEKLLDDVLHDANYNAFRAETYALARAELRHRRVRWKGPLWLALAACLLFAAILFVRPEPKKSENAQPRKAQRDSIAAFQPDIRLIIPFVRTEPIEPLDVIRTVRDRSLFFETPARVDLEIVQSSRGTVDELDDDAMLALFAGQPAGFLLAKEGKSFVLFVPADESVSSVH